jgi:hypothetical protein
MTTSSKMFYFLKFLLLLDFQRALVVSCISTMKITAQIMTAASVALGMYLRYVVRNNKHNITREPGDKRKTI